MANSEVDIANMARMLLGAETIMDLDECPACYIHFDDIRDVCLEESDWTFAMKRKVLSSPDATSPLFDYSYKFLLPTDCLRVVKVNGNEDDWVKEGDYILSDEEEVEVLYVSRVEDIRKMPPSFIQVFATRLASVIAIPITNSAEYATAYFQLYGQLLIMARGSDGRQGKHQKVNRNVTLRRHG